MKITGGLACMTTAISLIASASVGTEVQLAGLSMAVESGLAVEPSGMTLRIKPGTAKVAGKNVTIAAETVVTVPPVAPESIAKEVMTLDDTLPVQWRSGSHLKACVTHTPLPGCLDPESVKLELVDGTALAKDKDFVMDGKWAGLGRKEGGVVATSRTKVLASYDARKMRMDALCADGSGKVFLLEGVSDKAIPEPPKRPTDAAVLAHIFLPYGSKSIELRQILPVGEPFPEPDRAEMLSRSAAVKSTLEKLRAGKPVTIVTWGDSVTANGDASKPELAFAQQFIIRLKERFPNSTIRHINAGIGATNTDMRLPKLQAEVLSHKPDLVTIEFVNDMAFDRDHLRKNWNSAIDQITSAGAEIVALTWHFTMPEMMRKKEPFGGETRPQVEWLREIAAERKIGLADTSKRWEHLEAEGLPYTTLLANGINHPDDRGHELFVKDLMTFFPTEN